MLSRLTVLLESGLEFTASRGNNQATEVRQRGTHDHVGNVVFMTWRVKDCVLFLGSVDDRPANLDSLSLGFLFIRTVHDVCKPPRVSTLILGFLFKLLDGSLVDDAHRVDQIAANRRFARINVPNENEAGRCACLVNSDTILIWLHSYVLNCSRYLLCLAFLLLLPLVLSLHLLWLIFDLLVLRLRVSLLHGLLGLLGTDGLAEATLLRQVDDLVLLLHYDLRAGRLGLGVGLLSSSLGLFVIIGILVQRINLVDHGGRLRLGRVVRENENSLLIGGNATISGWVVHVARLVVHDEELGGFTLEGKFGVFGLLFLSPFLI